MSALDDTISATTKKLERQLRRKAIADYASQARARKAQKKTDDAARKADTRRKIELGGLLIVAAVDDWEPATLVGGLLALSRAKPESLAAFRDQGIAHMEARKAKR